MSAITSSIPLKPSNATANTSAWNRGPPSQPHSGTSSPYPNSGSPQPGNPSSLHVNGNGSGGQAAPTSAAAGHSRKGSLMVGGGMDIKRGNIAFGTVDSPNPLLSSSPAAPSITGTHLADNVKSFGSIEADTTDPNSVKPPSRRPSNLAMSPPPKKQPDLHAMFGKPGNMERRQSMGQNGQNGPVQNGLSPMGNGPMGQNGAPYAQQFRPPSTSRSPVMNPAIPNYSQFRPQMQQQGAVRPNGIQQMQPNMRPMMPYGMPQPYMGQYPPQGYYPNQFYEQQQQYGMPQWAPQQHPQNQSMMSPRGPPPQMQSPAPQPAGLPNSGGPSPLPTPPSRPPSLMQPTLPSTPSRPMQPGASFTPGSSFSMSGGAASFTPRTSKAIKIARADGTEVDLKSVAASNKPPPSSVSSSGLATPDTPSEVAATPAAKKFSLPVIVRIESEDQKKQRMKDEADREKIRLLEEKEEKERKERKERLAKEAEEKKLAEEKAKSDAEEAKKMEAAMKAEEEASKKLAEERAAIAEAQEDKEAADKLAETHAATEAAQSKADEQRRALLASTPTTPTTPQTATLPPKPTPIDDSSPVTETPSALTTAKPIEDLSAITYPSTYQPPSPRLNVNAEPGKFRYDRDFLMQFMQVCKEKPEGLPSLEDIGLEADTSSGFGSRRGPRAPVNGRGAPAGLGIGGVARPQGMGNFGMGNFSSVRGTTSEERFIRSSSQAGSRGNMIRTPSQAGPMGGLPLMSGGSVRGGPRSQPGTKRPPRSQAFEPEVAPLVSSTNSWVKARPTANDESDPSFIERKVKALLNKLTQEKFESIATQILEWANKSKNEPDGMTLKLVIKQVFDKATDEAHWSEMYAQLARFLCDRIDPGVSETLDGKLATGGVLFRKYLIGRCQVDFESGWKARELAVTAAAAKSAEDKDRLAKAEQDKEQGKEGEAAMLSDEYYAAQKAKRRGLGLVQLIGELYKLEMITTRVIKTCLIKLLGNLTDPDEEDIESTCKLLTTVGGQFEAQGTDSMNQVMGRLEIVMNGEGISSRIKFMIMDMFELRKAGWKSKKTQSSVMTIAQIHQQAAKEQAQKAAQAQSSRESISRGGSRAGRQRDNNEWSVQQPARLPQRPMDTSGLGKISSSGAAPTFAGPASVFSKRGKANAATPPISRQASQANMFSALNEAAEPAAEPTPERKKLNLKPRTKPMPGEGEGEAEAEAEAEEEEDEEPEEEESAEPSAPAGMSEEAAKTKIASDMKELWGEKDQGGSRNPDDIAEYYKALPAERQPLLSIQLVDDAFRLSKVKDAEVVANGLKAALAQSVATLDVLKRGIEQHMGSLDDDAIDFPQAYKAIALCMRGLSLTESDITALADKIDVYGEPKITPKQKLERALAAVDEEAKA